MTSSLRPICRFLSTASNRIISFEKVSALLEQEDDIKAQFEDKGYLVFAGPDSQRQTLANVTDLFGTRHSHIRSPSDGIVEITNLAEDLAGNRINSSLHFLAHTDGHYLEGIALDRTQTIRIGPPKIVVLQCIKPAHKGGMSFLVDGKAMLSTMLYRDPDVLKTLFASNCISIRRDNRVVMNLPIFQKTPSHHYTIRFSGDRDLLMPAWSKDAVEFFNHHYVLNPIFMQSLSLKERQILVLDNYRYLHGRTQFEGERFFRRTWILDENLSYPMYPLSSKDETYYGSDMNNQPTSCQAYGPIPNLTQRRFSAFAVGIRLSQTMQTAIENIIQSTNQISSHN